MLPELEKQIVTLIYGPFPRRNRCRKGVSFLRCSSVKWSRSPGWSTSPVRWFASCWTTSIMWPFVPSSRGPWWSSSSGLTSAGCKVRDMECEVCPPPHPDPVITLSPPCLLRLLPPREHSPFGASLPSAHPPLSRAPSSALACFHEFPAVARATEGLHSISGVWHAPPEWNIRREKLMPYIHGYVNGRRTWFSLIY